MSQQWPTWLELDLDVLVGNLQTIRQLVRPDAEIMLTVKADAYGHGAPQIAAAADPHTDRFGVATVEEAVEILEAGITKPILILSPVLQSDIGTVLEHGFELTVNDVAFARELNDVAAKRGAVAAVHVELDTGMGRTGNFAADAELLLRGIASKRNLRIAGVFTHFPVSDTDIAFTRKQLDDFESFVARLRPDVLANAVVHAANSAAITGVLESHLQLVRPGLLAYGYLPGRLQVPSGIGRVMSWKTVVAQLRDVPKDTPISYGHTLVTRRATRMGILPVGYGHGYPFRLTGSAQVLVGGERVPVMGRVTMDMIMVDLTDVDVRVGDEVVLLGAQGDERITADDLAEWAGSISYEVLCRVSKRVTRVYLRGGRIETSKTLLGVSTHATPQ